jgi:hypothetical protein
MSTTQVYAERRGLEWHSRLRLPCPGSHGGGTARYRVAIGSRRDEPAARQLLDGDFTEWHLTHGHQGNQLSNAGSFELTAGVVLISGAGDEFESDATTDEFAQFVKEFAARVASIAPEHAHA